MIFYDYLPSQNAWKIRYLLKILEIHHQVQEVQIFAGGGQRPDYLAVNPWGAVPAIKLDDGRVLSESGAILWYLAQDSAVLPRDAFERAKVLQWLSFEVDYIQSSIGLLRYWNLTAKLAAKPVTVVADKRQAALRVLRILEEHLAQSPFMVGGSLTIADIAVFAYAHLADEATINLYPYVSFRGWCERFRAFSPHWTEVQRYDLDPLSVGELPVGV